MLNKILPFLFLSSSLLAQCYEFESNLVQNPVSGNQFYLEPQITSATYKTSEIKQKGYLYGICGGFDFINYNAPYIGFESVFRSGKLKDKELKSKYTDYAFQAKIGMTLGTQNLYYLIPYAGVGYDNEKNNYNLPPVEKISYYYASVGCVSHAFLSPELSFGVNLKLKFPFSGQHKVKNDEIDVNFSVSKKIQYLVEVPLTYWASKQLNVAAIPFYEYKNYNNNSVDTVWNSKAKMSQWGLGLRGTFCF